MKLFKFTKTTCTPEEFVKYWSNGYDYVLEDLYKNNINAPWSRNKVLNLFKWKNGKNLSQRKLQSVEVNYLSRLGNLPTDLTLGDGIIIFDDLNGGPIWNIFWLHLLRSDIFPIFDRHTYRAFYYLTQGEISELRDNNEHIRDIYFNEYIQFFNQFIGIDRRDVDKALFTFGRFLKKHRFLFI
ncbi:MAG: hypothetical protein IT279_06300 [Ignavibacteriaceae bacterium]|nr:hypothetical protein [Ignavibacteriaceae bacterium]